ncbi:MAG: DUF2334 domain-containing protein [Clostridia bacterium]|nr:DUF2334 domain-containing protein [Clostridia bacterium]
MSKNKYLLVRIDDVCSTMNQEKFNRVINLLNEYNVKPLLGVVPENRDDNLVVDKNQENFWEYVLDLTHQGYAISQHGYSHVYTSKDGGILKINNYSEFAGLSYNEQYNKLKCGKEILNQAGLYPEIFMAPAHSFDKNTLKALKQLGFKYVTDGFDSKMYRYKGLTFIPCCHWYKIVKLKGLATLCLHPNTMTETDFNDLKESLETFKNYLKDYTFITQIQDVRRGRWGERYYSLVRLVKKVLKR